MSDFMALLELYYACDIAAATRALDTVEVTLCLDHYAAVKSYFAPLEPLADVGTHERADQERLAFSAFKSWETEHSEVVEALRASIRG